MSGLQDAGKGPVKGPTLEDVVARLAASVDALVADVATLKAKSPPATPRQQRNEPPLRDHVGNSGGTDDEEPLERINPLDRKSVV